MNAGDQLAHYKITAKLGEGGMGEPDAAFRVLEQAHADQDIVMTLLATDGILMAKELHADEHYAELLERVGFPRSILDVER